MTPADITTHDVVVNGRTVHHLARAGEGPPVVLLHGWPQHARSWLPIMAAIAPGQPVLVPDLPGIGGSGPGRGATKAELARDVHEFVRTRTDEPVVVIGHDVGGMVAYAYARLFPEQTAAAAMLDVPLPGIDPWDEVLGTPEAWHFRFHAQDPLAEQLVAGRERTYFRYFADSLANDPAAVTDAAIARAAGAYAAPAQLSAGFAFYRAFADDARANRAAVGPLAVPLLVAGGAASMGESVAVTAAALRAGGASDVRETVVPACGHWMVEEAPAPTLAVLNDLIMSRRAAGSS